VSLADTHLLDFIQRIYANVHEETAQFQEIIQDLSDLLQGAFVAVLRFNRLREEMRPGHAEQRELTSSRLADDFLTSWAEEFHQDIPWFELFVHEQPGQFIEIRNSFAEAEIRASRYYQEWMKPAGFAPLAVMGSTTPPTGESLGWAWFLYRDSDFEPEEVEFCRVLDGHLGRATRATGRLRSLEGDRDAALALLDVGVEAVVFLSSRGEVTWFNRRAEEVMDGEPALRLEKGRLRGAVGAVDEAPRAAIAGATARDEDGARTGRPAIVSVARGAKELPLGVAVVPVARPVPDLRGAECAAVAFLIDSKAVRRPPIAVLEALYELTPAEARLARALAAGQSPAEFATATGRSRETVRTQLKFLFRKLGVNRQTDLVRMLTSAPAGLDEG
jgi:DNA-binding CsgD family transcriptional regulator